MIKPYKHDGKTYFLIQLSYTDKLGKRHQPKFRLDKTGKRISSKQVAKILEIEYLIELKAKIEQNYSKLCFKEYHQKYLQEIKLSLKRSTVMQYDGDLKKWLTKEIFEKKMDEIKKADIHNFVFESLPSMGATPHTQKRILKTLRKIFQSALEEGIISRNPAQGISVKVPPPKKLVLNTQEASRLLERSKEDNHPFYHLWAFALLSGLRSGELYALRWADVDEVAGTINISASWSNKDGYHSTKSNKNRVIPISKDLLTLLLELKNIGPFEETLTGLTGKSNFFCDLVLPRSSEWKHGEQARITKAFCRLIGVAEIKFHDLRATFITNMLAQGVSLPKVMSIVGHSRTSTTDEYLRLAGVNIQGATESLGYSLPKKVSGNIVSLYETN